MKMKRLLFISLFILSGCASQPTVNDDSGSEITDLQDTIESMQSQINDLETKVEDLEYENEYLAQDVEDLRYQVETTDNYSFDAKSEDNTGVENTANEQNTAPSIKVVDVKPNNPSGRFTIGSSKEHVEKIMGSPDSVVLTSWWYGKQSWVSFDKNGLVESFYNGGNNLKTK